MVDCVELAKPDAACAAAGVAHVWKASGTPGACALVAVLRVSPVAASTNLDDTAASVLMSPLMMHVALMRLSGVQPYELCLSHV